MGDGPDQAEQGTPKGHRKAKGPPSMRRAGLSEVRVPPRAEDDSFGRLPDYVWEQMTDDEKRTHIRAKRAARPKEPEKPKASALAKPRFVDETPKLADDVWTAMSDEEKKAHSIPRRVKSLSDRWNCFRRVTSALSRNEGTRRHR